MKKLTVLPTEPSYLEWYEAIRDKKHRDTRASLNELQELIERRYVDYADAVENQNLSALESDDDAIVSSDLLRSCYGGTTKPLRDLKKAIKDAQPKRLLKYCPMCATTLPRTFDHYLPGVKFPEYAVYAPNLVPCCSICNSIKDDDWLSAAGTRQYLHAYSDEIPDRRFVVVTLYEDPALAGVGATFSLDRPDDIEDASWQLIKSHFSKLKLIERYDDGGNDEVAEIIADCGVFLETGGVDARDFLNRRALERFKVYGTNNWIAVLMEAMAKHANLSKWIEQGICQNGE
ncbi:hypothetical protein [Herbaspirillum sp.]|uniref:hypothetical protein n=1 Tax=Herbaspirillum sp. TaxID=1890675 RepID=UPI001B1EBD85|nr:hypothetical protein [Herbaspirillum sp.]MBO9537350.1 hypothetical protein [Herbaspirillum sp.]